MCWIAHRWPSLSQSINFKGLLVQGKVLFLEILSPSIGIWGQHHPMDFLWTLTTCFMKLRIGRLNSYKVIMIVRRLHHYSSHCQSCYNDFFLLWQRCTWQVGSYDYLNCSDVIRTSCSQSSLPISQVIFASISNYMKPYNSPIEDHKEDMGSVHYKE